MAEAESDVNFVHLSQELSETTFAALMQFLPSRRFDDSDEGIGIAESTVCVAYTANDVNVISDTVKRLAEKNSKIEDERKVAAKSRVLLDLEATPRAEAVSTIIADGVVRLNEILSVDLCDRMLESVNSMLGHEISIGNVMSVETGFGNVLCREHRWDLYLRNEGVCGEALLSMLRSPQDCLPIFFSELFNGCDAEVHELSALISDRGAASQPIHPDTVFTDIAPLYTVFIALQDVEATMGPTIFLPRTNTALCHQQHKDTSTKDMFLSSCEYKQCLLRKGDVAIMDSRIMHCGHVNSSSRRVLMYLTVRNPLYTFNVTDAPIPVGSKWSDLDMKLSDFASDK